jgi:hypothetical protein
MSTDLVPANFTLPAALRGKKVENELSAGIAAGFALIGFKGKVWSVRHQGTTTPLMRPDNDGPVNSIEVVIVKASTHISKIYYEGKYTEGSNAAPDCFSTNGVVPEAGALKKQAASCAACPKNAWGSRITDAGKQGKACADSKRLAVVWGSDLKNEAFGGPMLLRVPAASLKELASLGDRMMALNPPFPGHAYITRISFDVDSAYPQFKFSAVRPLTDAEYEVVAALREDPRTTRILAEGSEVATATPPEPLAPPAPSPFEQPAPAGDKPPQALRMPPVTAEPPAAVVTPKVTEPAVDSKTNGSGKGFEADFDAKLDALMAGR